MSVVKTEAEKVAEVGAEVRALSEAAEPGSAKARLAEAADAIDAAHEALVSRSAAAAEAKREAEAEPPA